MTISVIDEGRQIPAAEIPFVRELEIPEGYLSQPIGIGMAVAVQDLMTTVPLFLADLLSVAFAWLATKATVALIAADVEFVSPAILIATLGIIPLAFFLLELYPAVNCSPACEFKRLFIGSALVSAAILASMIPLGSWPQIAATLLFLGLFTAMAPMARMIVRSFVAKFEWWRQPTYISGSEAEVMRIAEWLDECPQSGMRPVRSIASSGFSTPSRAVVCMPRELIHAWDNEVPTEFVRVAFLPSEDLFAASTSTERAAALSAMQTKYRVLMPSYRLGKRVFDLLLVLTITPLLAPLLLILAVVVKCASRGPIFYGHLRVGRDGKPFVVRKFRTMHVDAQQRLDALLSSNAGLRREWELNHKLKNDPRITSVGGILRLTSLDELPQLWNILWGDMSFVGPRPIVEDEISKFGNVYPLYAAMTPGVTGLWQISGRNNTKYEDRLVYVRYYYRTWSPWLDVFILMRTLKTAMLCEGAY